MARLLALCSLPRRNPGSQLRYIRRNGPYTLAMTAGVNNKLPYGNLPRLLLAWVCTEAVRTQNRELILGRSLADFMRSVGVYDDGGAVRRRLRNQMQRLFRSHVELVYEDAHGSRFVNSAIADSGEFWWDAKHPDQPALWESKIELGEKFFHEVITNPIPLDLNILKAVKRSPLGLDLYLWLTYRTFALKRPLRLTWPLLYRQFGADPAKLNDKFTIRNFRTDCLRELQKINRPRAATRHRTQQHPHSTAPARSPSRTVAAPHAPLPAADQANASQADPPGLTVSVSVSALQHLIIEVLRRPVEFTRRALPVCWRLHSDNRRPPAGPGPATGAGPP